MPSNVVNQAVALRGEESIRIVRRGKWVWKTYKPLDPTGRWPGEHFWREQLEKRVAASRELPHVNRIICWGSGSLIAVSRFIEAVRETTTEDAAAMRAMLPKWIGDVTPRNVIVGADGPVLIDFCVNRV